MNKRDSVCIFCAASEYIPKIYKETAIRLGELCAQHGVHIINGAGFVGLMGDLSNSCLKAQGKVTGVIPQFMVQKGWQHKGLTNLIITSEMTTRKQKMRDLSCGIIALAGGSGTMDELFEAITAKQLDLYTHPIIVINTDGFYNPIKDWLNRSIKEHFMGKNQINIISFAETPEEALNMFFELPDSKNSFETRPR